MIDYDTIKQTGDGDRFDRLTALLIGIVAVLAALLVVVQTVESLAEARANANARRLASELTTRIIAGGTLRDHGVVNGQRSLLVSMRGNARQIVSFQTGDLGQGRVGEAEVAAGNRLAEIALRMGATPDDSSPLDPYARSVLATTTDELFAVLEEQNAQADLAGVASSRSSQAVMGLSVVALAGVLVGLAAVVGSGRAGRALLLVAWIAGLSAAALLGLASGVLVT